jgi:multisubunit Na+/H+ antiporter MnhF subunit
MSLLDTIETNSNLPLILKIVGIAMFGIAFVGAWSHIPFFYRFLMIIGLLAFIVGLKFVKVYSPTP